MADTQFTDISDYVLAQDGKGTCPQLHYVDAIKRLIDNNAVARLAKIIRRYRNVVNMKFEHEVYVLIPDVTSLYKKYMGSTEYDGNITETIKRNITLADYACITDKPACFKLLLNKGSPASIYSVQHLGRMIDMFARESAFNMMLTLLIKYPNIQDVRQDPEISPHGVTFSSVFPFGSTHENDDEFEVLPQVPLKYYRIMLDHGVKKDSDPPESYKEDYVDKMHSFTYNFDVQRRLYSNRTPTFSTVTAKTRLRTKRMLTGL